MNELTPVTQIDLAVHFDWMRAITANATVDMVNIERDMCLQRCRNRLLEIASNPTALVFYFSSFFEKYDDQLQRGRLVSNQSAYLQDVVRILEYQFLLGNRFFLFADHSEPNREQLSGLLQSRGFTFHQEHTTLSVYGEYSDLCVANKLVVVQKALGLDPKNCSVEENLSRSSGVINRKLP